MKNSPINCENQKACWVNTKVWFAWTTILASKAKVRHIPILQYNSINMNQYHPTFVIQSRYFSFLSHYLGLNPTITILVITPVICILERSTFPRFSSPPSSPRLGLPLATFFLSTWTPLTTHASSNMDSSRPSTPLGGQSWWPDVTQCTLHFPDPSQAHTSNVLFSGCTSLLSMHREN